LNVLDGEPVIEKTRFSALLQGSTDANAADTDADHNAALTAFYSTFGDIMPTDVLMGLLTGR
jgi:hypothetical protein